MSPVGTEMSNPDEEKETNTENRDRPPRDMRPPWMENRMGMGMPGGASPTDFDKTPPAVENEADYWRGQAIQLEKALQDIGSIHSQQARDHTFWSQTAGNEKMSLEELLGHLWHRGIELVGVFAAMVFLVQMFGTNLPPIAQVAGAVAVTAFFDRYIRPIISQHI